MKRSSGVACWKGCVSVFLAVMMFYCPRVVVADTERTAGEGSVPVGGDVGASSTEGCQAGSLPQSDREADLEAEYARRESEAPELEEFVGGSDAFVSAVTVTLIIAAVAIVLVLLMLGAEGGGGGGGGGYNSGRGSSSGSSSGTSEPPKRRTHTCNICGGSGYSGQSSDRKCGMCNGTGVTPWTREE